MQEQGTVTIGFKGTAETKSKVDALAAQLGITQKDLLDRLLDTFMANKQAQDMDPEDSK